MVLASRVALAAVALAAVGVTSAARADPPTGIPDGSIAVNLPYDAARASLAAAGINYGLSYTGEYFNVTSGGLSRGSTYNGLVQSFVDVDLEKLVGWKGATIHASAFYVHGDGPSQKTGSSFAVSNLEGFETIRLDDLWFEQSLIDDKLKIKLGALAADTEFFVSDTSGFFLNGTFGWAGIVAADMVQGGPAYPLTSMGARVAFNPNDNLTILAAVFNGSPANPLASDPQRDNRHGTDFRFGDGQLMMIEGQYRYDIGLPGTVKLGGWKQFNVPDGAYTDFRNPANPIDNNHGLYAIVDQQIWKNGDHQGVSIFGRISGSPERQSMIDFYFDTGIVFTGFVPGRSKDNFGAAFGYGQISDDLRATAPGTIASHESVLEINYSAHVMPGVTLTPDFQYFWNPGVDTAVDHATVFGLRAKVNY